MNFKSILFCTFVLMGTCHGAHSPKETITRVENEKFIIYNKHIYDDIITAYYDKKTERYSVFSSRSSQADFTTDEYDTKRAKGLFNYFAAEYERRLSETR